MRTQDDAGTAVEECSIWIKGAVAHNKFSARSFFSVKK